MIYVLLIRGKSLREFTALLKLSFTVANENRMEFILRHLSFFFFFENEKYILLICFIRFNGGLRTSTSSEIRRGL